MKDLRYSPNEILQILNDCYNFQAVFDPEVYPGFQLTFDTTIRDWRDTCDLLPVKKLTKAEHTIWELNTPVEDLEQIISNQNNTLATFCNYIAVHAPKTEITPVNLLGQHCMTAAIFRTLMTKLYQKGVNTRNIKPSSEFAPLFRKHGATLLIEVNKLAPGSLSKFKNERNWVDKLSAAFLLVFFLVIIVVPLIWSFHRALFIPLAVSIILGTIAYRLKLNKETFCDYITVRDLINGMHLQLQKSI